VFNVVSCPHYSSDYKTSFSSYPFFSS